VRRDHPEREVRLRISALKSPPRPDILVIQVSTVLNMPLQTDFTPSDAAPAASAASSRRLAMWVPLSHVFGPERRLLRATLVVDAGFDHLADVRALTCLGFR
jgi:hypothetical protein